MVSQLSIDGREDRGTAVEALRRRSVGCALLPVVSLLLLAVRVPPPASRVPLPTSRVPLPTSASPLP